MKRSSALSVAVLFAAVASCRAFGEEPPAGRTAEAALCTPPPRPPGRARLEPAFPALVFAEPTRLVRAQAGARRWYVTERAGLVRVFDDRADVEEAPVFADIKGRVFIGSVDDGIMGLALHPRFDQNGEVFIGYTAPARSSSSVLEYHIDRARSRDGGLTIDPSTLETVLSFPKKESIHHGGPLAFGPDGMLYVAIGDGQWGDPQGDAQRSTTLFGKVLRIDVDAERPYAVPDDNPFVDVAGARPEIWALGFRNPWTMTFDGPTGDLWLGDVGHGEWEEIDRVVRGGNYGWRVREGRHCFGAPSCRSEGLVDPVFEYSHSDGFAVTAAFVYRGASFPDLAGAFVFGDFVTGRVSALRGQTAEPLLESGKQIAGFAEDREGEVLLIDYGTGTVHRLLPEDRPDEIPKKLSDSGCFDPAMLFAYEVASPLWSDGAAKERALYIPEDAGIVVRRAGNWELPPGSVAWKTFVRDGRKIETRMLVNHEEGGWAGYTYAWDRDGRDATLLERGETRDGWTFPSRGDCFACHNLASGRTLGLTTAQMSVGDQIARLEARGMFAEPPPPQRIEDRARAYLDTNCSICHRPGGPASGLGDMRGDRTLVEMKVCNIATRDARAGMRLVAPGDPSRSAIAARMRSTGTDRMPPLATRLVDHDGIALIEAWIRALDPAICPASFPTSP